MYDLKDLRNKIDEIDSKLLPLFLERMECSRNVAEYKRANNMPVFDKEREEQILDDKAKKVDAGQASAVRDFFAGIMSISRAAQIKALADTESFGALLKDFGSASVRTNPTVVYQGIPGANSETALLKYFGEACEKRNVMTFAEVADAVLSGEADFGILPLENSSTGSISGVLDLFEKHSLYIIGEVSVGIDHCLVGIKGAELRDIRTVYSHEQGYMQCKKFFDNYPKMEFTPYHNTAMAAKMISGIGDPSVAAIADRRCSELYGLDILAENISSIGTNITRFAVISKKGILDNGSGKVSIIFTLPNQSGALSSLLSVFSDSGLNLVKIESRPSHNGSFEYIFFVDFEGNLNDPRVKDVLSVLNTMSASLKILGNYSVL